MIGDFAKNPNSFLIFAYIIRVILLCWIISNKIPLQHFYQTRKIYYIVSFSIERRVMRAQVKRTHDPRHDPSTLSFEFLTIKFQFSFTLISKFFSAFLHSTGFLSVFNFILRINTSLRVFLNSNLKELDSIIFDQFKYQARPMTIATGL